MGNGYGRFRSMETLDEIPTTPSPDLPVKSNLTINHIVKFMVDNNYSQVKVEVSKEVRPDGYKDVTWTTVRNKE